MINAQKNPASKKISLAEMEPVLCELLSAGGSFRMTITGTSMLPTLHDGRDQVEISAPARPYRKYDLPLYKRDNGQFVLHRIVRIAPDGSITCCGDHQCVLEPGLRQDQMLGLVVGFCRKGKSFSADHLGYRIWVRFWMMLFPCRHFLVRVYHFVDRLRKKRP